MGTLIVGHPLAPQRKQTNKKMLKETKKEKKRDKKGKKRNRKRYESSINFIIYFQTHVPDQIMKVINAESTDDNDLFKPLKKFPETFSEQEKYIQHVHCTCLCLMVCLL